MSEMVERVARAMYEGQRNGAPWDGPHASEWRDLYFERARLAIEAMREPTAAMIDAGYQEDYGGPGEHFIVVPCAWRAMIDAALK